MFFDCNALLWAFFEHELFQASVEIWGKSTLIFRFHFILLSMGKMCGCLCVYVFINDFNHCYSFFIENTWRQFKYDILAVIFLLNFFSSSLERIEVQTQVHPHILTKKNFSIHLPLFLQNKTFTPMNFQYLLKKIRILHCKIERK